MNPMAWLALIPANAPVLSDSVVAAETYDLATAAFPKHEKSEEDEVKINSVLHEICTHVVTATI